MMAFKICRFLFALCSLLLGKSYATECFINLTEVNFGAIRIADLQADWHSSAYPVDLQIDCRGNATDSTSPVRLTALADILNGHPALLNAFTSELTLRSSWQGISAGTPVSSSAQWLTAIKAGLQEESYFVIPLLFRLYYKSSNRIARDSLFRLVGPFNGQRQWLLEIESTQHIVSFSYRGSFTNGTCRVGEQSIDFGHISTSDIREGSTTRNIQLGIYCDSFSLPNALQFHGESGSSDFISSSALAQGIAVRIKNRDHEIHSNSEIINNNDVLYFSGKKALSQTMIIIPMEISLIPSGSLDSVSGGSFSVPIVVKFMY